MSSAHPAMGGATTAEAGAPSRTAWTRRDAAILSVVLIVGAAVRAALLPTQGFRGDLDVFATWTQGIAAKGLDHAYDGSLNFPPIMALAYGALAAIGPAFRTAVDASDTWLRVLLKLPAIVGDGILVASLLWLFRRAPRWAILGAMGIALNPAVILVSAWWGQYESLYCAWAMVAVVLAVESRVAAGGAAVALSVMTKPQALPFLLPFGAWVGGRHGLRRLAVAAGAVALAVVALWLPFVAAGGPSRFLDTLRSLQNGTYSVVTLNAWNLWGLFQGPVEPGALAIPDNAALVGPLSARLIGLVLAGACMVVLLIATWTSPSRSTLVGAMSSAALIAFAFLTTMHERYLFPVAVLPLALVWWAPARWGAVAVSAILLAQLIATPGAGLVDAGARSALDLLRVPMSALIVIAALGSIALVASRRLPADAAWDEALALPAVAPSEDRASRHVPHDERGRA